MTTISVCIPSIPPRAHLLPRAVASVAAQTRPADEIIVQIDREGHGAAVNRDRTLHAATSEWVAFLDDDDELLPWHLEHLLAHAEETGADMVFPWFDVIGGVDPFPQHFGRKWTLDDPTQTTITMLVRRDAALDVGGFYGDYESPDDTDDLGNKIGEDFEFVLRLARRGYKIEHMSERTWRWHHTGHNLSGRSWTKAAA